MNKRVIWLIIGVMSVAVIGVVTLQVALIMTSIRANEEAFDKNVHSALSSVATRIEAVSNTDDLLYIANGYSKEYLDYDGLVNRDNGGMSIPVAATSRSAVNHNEELITQLITDASAKLEGVENIKIDFVDTHRPLEERIDAGRLVQIVEQELQNRAIKADYHFGVFSDERKAYVILDGAPLTREQQRQQDKNLTLAQLAGSPFRVMLFEDKEGKRAGYINILFPEKSNLLWRAVLPSFLGTFLFAVIILACFGYTVWVIFHQKRLSEMKTDFINNMTHEFKTPIATISLAADSIANPKISGDVSKVLRFANIIKQENKRMNSQVEKVLQMAQIDRGESKLLLSEVDLHEIIHRAIENIGLQVELRQGSATAELNAANPVVEGDITHLSNVINNLLDNANKYSPDTPVIQVTTRDRADGVEVTVSDQGLGMSKEARKHIFDKFYRVHTGDLHDVKGFGLGLSYVKAIMDAHKGSVDVRSEPGKGSDFVLFFPRKQHGAAANTMM